MNFAYAKGFDLFFDEVSANDLSQIANDVGGNSSFDIEEGRVTHFFKSPVLVEMSKVAGHHDMLDIFGYQFAEKYHCKFNHGEFYIRTDALTALSIDRWGLSVSSK